MIILGIDPGLAGGLVALNDAGAVVHKAVMPTLAVGGRQQFDTSALIVLLEQIAPNRTWVEKQQTFGGGAFKAARGEFGVGLAYGILLGALAALRLSHGIVAPRTWQAEIFRDHGKEDTKATARIVAERLWPQEDFRATERSRTPHGGLVDAALVACYGLRVERGKLAA